MKAAVFHAAHQPLTIEEVEIEKPKRREVLLRTAFAGLCHSDLHFMEGLYPYPAPAVLGHEGAAVVEAVGEDVTYVKPGDHVITCLSVFCGECEYCTTGHTNLCDNTEVKLLPGAARRLKWKGEMLQPGVQPVGVRRADAGARACHREDQQGNPARPRRPGRLRRHDRCRARCSMPRRSSPAAPSPSSAAAASACRR